MRRASVVILPRRECERRELARRIRVHQLCAVLSILLWLALCLGVPLLLSR